MFGFLKKFKRKIPIHLTIQINDKLMPIDRGEVYEDPLDTLLIENGFGVVTGGGTALSDLVEVTSCNVDIKIHDYKDLEQALNCIIDYLVNKGIPNGSKIIISETESEISLGATNGIAVYIDGVNLPKEVYQQCDINFVEAELSNLLGCNDKLSRHWEGQTETALYFYTEMTFAEMNEKISHFISTYPLCQNARIVEIA